MFALTVCSSELINCFNEPFVKIWGPFQSRFCISWKDEPWISSNIPTLQEQMSFWSHEHSWARLQIICLMLLLPMMIHVVSKTITIRISLMVRANQISKLKYQSTVVIFTFNFLIRYALHLLLQNFDSAGEIVCQSSNVLSLDEPTGHN